MDKFITNKNQLIQIIKEQWYKALQFIDEEKFTSLKYFYIDDIFRDHSKKAKQYLLETKDISFWKHKKWHIITELYHKKYQTVINTYVSLWLSIHEKDTWNGHTILHNSIIHRKYDMIKWLLKNFNFPLVFEKWKYQRDLNLISLCYQKQKVLMKIAYPLIEYWYTISYWDVNWKNIVKKQENFLWKYYNGRMTYLSNKCHFKF